MPECGVVDVDRPERVDYGLFTDKGVVPVGASVSG